MAGSFLRQSTASQSRATPPFLDDTDFKTAETALTIANTDVKLIVNGGASADKNSGGGTHRANGVYGLTFDATDTATVGELEVSIKVAGALPVFMKFWVLEEAVYDAFFAASALGYVANAPVNVAQFGGTNGTFSGGRPEVNTSHAAGTAWNSGAIGASTLASDTIAAAKIATGAITAAKFAAGAIDAAAIADNAIDAGALAADCITAAKIATGAIDADAIAADAIGSSELAASAVTEIQAGLSTLDAAGVRTAVGLASANLDTQLSAIDDFIDTEISTLLTRLGTPSDLGSGATVAANLVDIESQTDDIGAAGAGLTALATQASVNTIDDFLDTEIAAIKAKTDNLPAAPAAVGDIPTAAQNATAVLTTAMTEAYRATNAPPTLAQAQFELIAHMGEMAISGTTKTLKKLDGSTTAKTYTLDSSSAPTSITETT